MKPTIPFLGVSLLFLLSSPLHAGFFDDLKKQAERAVQDTAKGVMDSVVPAKKQESKPRDSAQSNARQQSDDAGQADPSARVTSSSTSKLSPDATPAGATPGGGLPSGIPPKTTFAKMNEARISIKHPSLVENSYIVPLNFTLTPTLAPGETLEIYSNGYLAFSFSPGGFGIQRTAFGVQLVGDRTIAARILDASGNMVAANAVTIATMRPPAERPALPRHTIEQAPVVSALKVRENRVKFQLKQRLALGRTGHVYLRSDFGSLSIMVTAYAARSFYVGFYPDRNPGSLEVISTGYGDGNYKRAQRLEVNRKAAKEQKPQEEANTMEITF